MRKEGAPSCWSRRDVLALARGATCALAATALACGSRPLGDDGAAASLALLARAGLAPSGPAAARLGELYRRHPGAEADVDALGRALLGGARPASAEEWRETLARARAADLREGRWVELDGWITTPTEARLLALQSGR